MPTNEKNGAYESLIRSIKRKRRWILALEIISLLIILAFAMPAYVEIMGEVLIDRAGFPLPITLLLILLVALIAIFANAAVLSPVVRALDEECDPEKHIILCEALLNKTEFPSFLATDHTYLGNLAEKHRINDFLILLVTMLANFVLEFLFCKLVVYKGKEDTLKTKKEKEAKTSQSID